MASQRLKRELKADSLQHMCSLLVSATGYKVRVCDHLSRRWCGLQSVAQDAQEMIQNGQSSKLQPRKN